MLEFSDYSPPAWTAGAITLRPKSRVGLGRLPTPIHEWRISLLDDLGVKWWIKRDDLSGFEMGGNKVRKLEFLMAEALEAGADCIVTIGGIQSNHCRATAAAARCLGLDAYLVFGPALSFSFDDCVDDCVKNYHPSHPYAVLKNKRSECPTCRPRSVCLPRCCERHPRTQTQG